MNYLSLYPVDFDRNDSGKGGKGWRDTVARKRIYASNAAQAELLALCIMENDLRNGTGCEFDYVNVGEPIEHIPNPTKFA